MSDTSNERRLVTPEGIELRFQLATVADRLAAFTLDGLILLGFTVGIALLMIFASSPGGLVGAFFMVFFFLLRSGYFVFFELGSRGATPGKRTVGIRVVSRSGGPLEGRAVFARNLTRELEIFLPMVALLAPDQVLGVSGLSAWLSVAWVFIFLIIPFFNRDHMRVGDLIAGTWVVRVPKPQLLSDMGASVQQAAGRYQFSEAQLAHYGNFELQTLEDLLRRADSLPIETLLLVSEKIRRRIEWTGEVEILPFLRAFYGAQRAHLERGLLFGRRHEDKRAARRAQSKVK